MAKAYPIYIWKKAPFLRLLLPLCSGIILSFYFKIPATLLVYSGIILLLVLFLFRALPEASRYKLRAVQGTALTLFLVVLGSFLCWQKNIRNHQNWYGNHYSDSSTFIASILEPPVEKARSFKALATISSCLDGDLARPTQGKILIYFAKDSSSKQLKYGDRIVIKNKIQSIKNSGNPAGFNYVQYLAFQQIYHQCYLKENDWFLMKANDATAFKNTLFKSRDYVVKTIDEYITGTNESALAKALLIGYRVDLDKDLVQAYSNAGVIHLIAISGLHLALIYGLLLWITQRIPLLKNAKITRIIVILLCLWAFAFLTGAPPSVMRAAVMFSFISFAAIFQKRSSIYNSLCASAFLLLCVNPFLLWDVGFQLSYLAVLGIVVLQKPIYKWFYFKNKIADYFWQLASVSLAAQLFTVPICFYYFHQFPSLFLIANMIAIPLATVALWGCIALIVISPISIISVFIGKVISAFLWLMNHSVLLINTLPFALWNNVSISLAGAILLYIILISLIYWLLKKSNVALKFALWSLLIFSCLLFFDKWKSYHQRKMIVYNVPAHSAIDFVAANKYYSSADDSLAKDPLLVNYNLKPTRISYLANNKADNNGKIFQQNNFFKFYDKRILIIDTAFSYLPLFQKIALDYIIVSKNPKIKIADLVQIFDCKNYIFDASNSLWKIDQWKKECEELHLHFHSVSEQGAYVIDL